VVKPPQYALAPPECWFEENVRPRWNARWRTRDWRAFVDTQFASPVFLDGPTPDPIPNLTQTAENLREP